MRAIIAADRGGSTPILLPRAHRYMVGIAFERKQPMPMTPETTSMMKAQPVASAAIAVAVVGAVTVLGAWWFQYGLGLKPCPLCLEQRYAYYFAVPLAVMVLLGDSYGASRKVLLAALIVIALGMLWNTALGVYHSGVEWKWWAGPQECSGALDDLGSASSLLEKLKSVNVVRCDEAAWRFLGLSLAGYNAVISLVLAAIAVWGAVREWRGRAG
jgi:disulfide bond formation protein DsbB